jgi:predicted negative regulator of RcsB-dependent stress response
MKTGNIVHLRVVIVLVLVALAGFVVAEDNDDAEAIKQAVLNYATAIYEVNPKLIDKSVHPRLQKVGYAPKKDDAGYREIWMTFDELKELTLHWNKDGHMDAATAKREV